MSFYTVDREIADESIGILYILVFDIDGETVYKIGVTQRKIQDRVAEILTSFWHQYRYYPYCRPKRFTSTSNVYKKEALMHKYFNEYRYKSEHVFGGCSELFHNVTLEELTEVYARCIAGEDICSTK